MRSQDIEFEHCCECDAHTGRAGRSEDSLYAGDRGPYCESCWDEMPDKLAEECDDKDAEIARLRRRLSEVESQHNFCHVIAGCTSDSCKASGFECPAAKGVSDG